MSPWGCGSVIDGSICGSVEVNVLTVKGPEKERFPRESLLGPNGAIKEGGIPNLALCLQICFVPNQHDGEIVAVLDSEDLSEELAYLIETAREAGSVRPPQGGTCPVLSQVSQHLPSPLPVIDGKHQQEAVASTHVLLPHGTKFLLTCSVQDCGDRERNMWVPGCPVSCLPSEPSRPYCPALRGCHPQSRSLCRNPQWWGHSQTRSRTAGQRGHCHQSTL